MAHPLSSAEGRALVSGPLAILKAALEADREIALITGPRHEGFSAMFSAATEEPVATLLRQHNVNLLVTPHARRAIALAAQRANSSRAAIALVPNAQLDQSIASLAATMTAPLPSGGALCVLLEDHPQSAPASCPRQAAMRLRMPCIEPADVAELRDMLDLAVRLSRIAGTPVALVVHAAVLRSSQTLEMRPNRVFNPVDIMVARRRRKTRWIEAAGVRDVLRIARRMELNRGRCLPNPGERVPVGFITVGPSDPAIAYVAEALHLHSRVPVLQLGLLHPVDEVAVSRLLSRCERAIVLEPRSLPGAVQSSVLAVAETMRRRSTERSERPASVWGRELPPDGVDAAVGGGHRLEVDESLHPSVLARKIVHLLHMIRPTMQVALRLAPDPPPTSVPPPAAPRGSDVGTPAAMAILRRLVTDVDQWLRGQAASLQERGIEPTALAIDGIEPPSSSSASRIVPVEFWPARAFQDAGIAAIRQAARDEQPWVMLVCDFDVADNQDIERLARGVIPAERAERVRIELTSIGDRAGLRSLLEEAVVAQRCTIILVRDAPAGADDTQPQFDVNAIERMRLEIDRFGFQPHQRVVWPVDQACLFTPPPDEELAEQEAEPTPPMRTEVAVDHFSKSFAGRARFKIQPLLEQIEVIRTRPPAWIWRTAFSGGAPARVELPAPLHRKQPVWRAHVAGFRGPGPGVAGHILSEAGRNMGYDVASIYDPTPIGPGRRGWTQVIFTRPPSEAKQPPREPAAITARRSAPPIAPYGEVDLLVGFDVHETLRAISPQETLRVAHPERTTLVANSGAFSEEDDRELSPAMCDAYFASLDTISMPGHRTIEDFAAACRTWFYTDRVADIAMLGVAFQRGLIPVSLEAIEAAVARMEERGFGRSSEAFQFGRYLATDARLLTRRREERDDDLHHMIRRMALGLRARGFRGQPRASAFEGLVRRSLSAMPGLAETAPGRRAQRDFVTAVHRAIEWGGFDYAVQYADLLTALYNADRGDTGRALTRSAVLPVAEAMLIHDPIYTASMATNPEQNRRLRNRLNIKHARGDQIERRYLTRIELVMLDRRFRADVRTSDWPARLARAARHIIPHRWRGTRRERDIKAYIIDFVHRAIQSAKDDYDRYSEAMQRLHLMATENRLRDMALAELRMLTEPSAPAALASTA